MIEGGRIPVGAKREKEEGWGNGRVAEEHGACLGISVMVQGWVESEIQLVTKSVDPVVYLTSFPIPTTSF